VKYVPEVEVDPFDMLGISSGSRKGQSVFKAAAVVLFLCRFALPWSGDVIRPSTFMAASRMVAGMKFNMAPAILCCLYRGLSRTYLSLSTHPSARGEVGKTSAFYHLHYLYGWIGLHFPRGVYAERGSVTAIPYLSVISGAMNAYFPWEASAADARALLRQIDESDFDFTPRGLSMPEMTDRVYDDGNLPASFLHYSISCRPGYLVFRRGDVVRLSIIVLTDLPGSMDSGRTSLVPFYL